MARRGVSWRRPRSRASPSSGTRPAASGKEQNRPRRGVWHHRLLWERHVAQQGQLRPVRIRRRHRDVLARVEARQQRERRRGGPLARVARLHLAQVARLRDDVVPHAMGLPKTAPKPSMCGASPRSSDRPHAQPPPTGRLMAEAVNARLPQQAQHRVASSAANTPQSSPTAPCPAPAARQGHAADVCSAIGILGGHR